MSKTILIVDDEPQIAEICRDYLRAAGFEVLTARDGPAGLSAARRERPDLIVLDLMLPGMDGLDVCRELRHDPGDVGHTPIIMLTARVEEADKLIGLELGADDYLTKPFSPRELVARVRTVLRRAGGPPLVELIRTRELTLDRARYQAILPGRVVSLTPTEFEILATLAAQPGRIFTRAQLLTAVRGVAFESYERAIDSHIRNLRRKIEAVDHEPPADKELPGEERRDENEPRYIITVHGVGYKFAE